MAGIETPFYGKSVNDAASDAFQSGLRGAQEKAAQKAALTQLLTGKKADLENKTAEMKSADDIKGAAQSREFAAAKQGYEEMKPDANGSKASIKYGDTSISTSEPNAALLAKKLQDKAAQEAAGMQKTYGAHDKNLQGQATVLENGINGVSSGTPQGYKMGAIALARLAEGSSSRIQLPVIEAMAQKSGFKTAQDFLNYVGGNASGDVPTDQAKAISDGLMQHHQRLKSESGAMASEFQSQAPFIAPTMAQNGTLQPYLQTFGKATGDSLGRIQGKFDDLNKATQGTINPAVKPPGPNTSPGLVGGIQSSLKDWFSGGKTAQPQGTSGATPPASTGTMRVKHKASGQTGTIPTSEFDPAQYEVSK